MAPKLFGTSSTNMNNLNQGALSNFAIKFTASIFVATALTPSKKTYGSSFVESFYISLN